MAESGCFYLTPLTLFYIFEPIARGEKPDETRTYWFFLSQTTFMFHQ